MIFGKAVQAMRNTGDETLTLDSTDGWNLLQSNGVSKSNAMKVSAVNACVETLSNSLAKLPFHIIHKETKEKVKTPLANLLTLRPNEAMAPSVFKKLVEVYRLLWGNAYIAPIRSPSTGRIVELLPLPADYTITWIDESGVLWYVVTNPKTGK